MRFKHLSPGLKSCEASRHPNWKYTWVAMSKWQYSLCDSKQFSLFKSIVFVFKALTLTVLHHPSESFLKVVGMINTTMTWWCLNTLQTAPEMLRWQIPKTCTLIRSTGQMMKYLCPLPSSFTFFIWRQNKAELTFSRVIHYHAVRLLFYPIKVLSNLLLIQPLLAHIKTHTRTRTHTHTYTHTTTQAEQKHIN